MKILALIPARYASTRFPAKPLADLHGKTMVRRVYERVNEVFADVWVATDHAEIFAECESFGGRAVMTSAEHKSGTDRCLEALEILENQYGTKWDAVINVQGDEPFIAISQLEAVRDLLADPETQIATLIKPFASDEPVDNPNSPKVVTDINGFALYFSRSVIPYLRGVERDKWQTMNQYFKHIGLYGYRADALRQIAAMEQSSLEIAESLEQLRWLENGLRIKTAVTTAPSYAIDTPEDLATVLHLFPKGAQPTI